MKKSFLTRRTRRARRKTLRVHRVLRVNIVSALQRHWGAAGLFVLALAVFTAPRCFAEDRCARIVSLAPSITETVYALGLGPKVVGVSRFCHFPSQVESVARVGGFLDPNYEAILAQNPSVVLYLKEFRERADELRKLALPVLELDQRRAGDIQESISQIGRYCNIESTASALRASLEKKIDTVKQKTSSAPKLRTLVVVGSAEVGSLKNLYVSGRDGFYDQLIAAAGGVNVAQGETKSAVALSLESIVRLDPEVIIEIYPDMTDVASGTKKAVAAWDAFPWVSAVKNHRIYILTEDYTYIPGPRFPLLLRKLASIIHPELG